MLSSFKQELQEHCPGLSGSLLVRVLDIYTNPKPKSKAAVTQSLAVTTAAAALESLKDDSMEDIQQLDVLNGSARKRFAEESTLGDVNGQDGGSMT